MKDDPFYVRDLPMVFVDTETSGTEENIHGLLQVAAVRTTPDGSRITREYSAKVKLADGLILDPVAVSINGYTPEAWADARSEAEVLPELFEILRGCSWVGHVPGFDRKFVDAGLSRAGQKVPLAWRFAADTASMSYPLVKMGLCSSVKLKDVCRALGIEQPQAHDALADARSCRQVYLEITRRFRKEPVTDEIQEMCGNCGERSGVGVVA